MNTLPKAEEYIKKFSLMGEEGTLSKKNLIWMLEDFSKKKAEFHVEAALKAAYKQGELNRDAGQDLNGISIDKDSILNAYPKELIK